MMKVITIVDLPKSHYRLVCPVTKWQLLVGVVGIVTSSLAYGFLG